MPSRATTSGCYLPASLKPTHYDLFVSGIVYGAPWTYHGQVQIHFTVISETSDIVLNVQELMLQEVKLVSTFRDTTLISKPININYDTRNLRCTLIFDNAIPSSQLHSNVLHIAFQGTINDQLTGFYRSSYQTRSQANDEEMQNESSPLQYMFSTQFQPCYARRAFPCFDEPGLKATFDFSIEVPEEMVALSNTSVKRERQTDKLGHRIVEFERIPMMSTYLLAWAVGDFEYIEYAMSRATTINHPVRLYTTKGRSSYGDFGLQMAVKSLECFSKIFQTEYPLSKLDMLVVHGMADDAMENSGLLTFRDTALLFDEANSDPGHLVRVAYIIAHEIAHQWFGNLVTMKWWDELWLNEGFATWAGWYVVDHFYPEWEVWADFVGGGMQEALHLDSLSVSHPVKVDVLDELAVESIFDAISYSKGSSLIRMLATHIGADDFLQGVSNYLLKFAYESTTGQDLWNALSAVSGLNVSSLITPWINTVGYPVITLEQKHHNELLLCQMRYKWSQYAQNEDNPAVWWIPITLRLHNNDRDLVVELQSINSREVVYEGIKLESGFEILNVQHAGFYRIDLPFFLLKNMAIGLSSLGAQEQTGLLGDIAASAASSQGCLSTPDLLSYIQTLRSQNNFHVWRAMLRHIANITSIFAYDTDIFCGLKRFILDLTLDAMISLGYNMTASTPPDVLTTRCRGVLFTAIGLAGHPEVVHDALTGVQNFLKGDTAVDPSLRHPVLSVAVAHGGHQVFQMLKNAYEVTPFIGGREIILKAMGQVQSADMAKEYLSFAFDGHVETQDLCYVVDGLASNHMAGVREMMWHFIKENWAKIEHRYAGALGTFEPLLTRALGSLASDDSRNDIESFFRDKETTGYARGLAVGLETVQWRTDYRKRDAHVLRKWLQAEGFAACHSQVSSAVGHQ